MLGIVVAAAGSGIAVSAIGRYKPWLVLGPLITCVGGGLLYTITAESSTAQLVGYQILLALGVGTALQNVLSTWSGSSLVDVLLLIHCVSQLLSSAIQTSLTFPNAPVW